MVKPRRRTGFFVRDFDYNSYDTLACVDKLKKSVDENDMMTPEEILTMRGEINPNNDNIGHMSHRLKRHYKKMNK